MNKVINALKLFVKRLTCKHTKVQLIDITFDGIAIYECRDCGKYIHKGW